MSLFEIESRGEISIPTVMRTVPDGEPATSLPMQTKPSLPSRIAIVGNHLPRQCGIATFTTDLCEALSAACGTARLLALPVNDTESGYDYLPNKGWQRMSTRECIALLESAGVIDKL